MKIFAIAILIIGVMFLMSYKFVEYYYSCGLSEAIRTSGIAGVISGASICFSLYLKNNLRD